MRVSGTLASSKAKHQGGPDAAVRVSFGAGVSARDQRRPLVVRSRLLGLQR